LANAGKIDNRDEENEPCSPKKRLRLRIRTDSLLPMRKIVLMIEFSNKKYFSGVGLRSGSLRA
jgi:hypothetical protein